jgi:hypothetical protein
MSRPSRRRIRSRKIKIKEMHKKGGGWMEIIKGKEKENVRE